MDRMKAPLLAVAAVAIAIPAGSRAQTVDAAAITVGAVPGQATQVLRDAYGRQVTLRGFNVSGSAKLNESGLLPFRSTADAVVSAQSMRDQTGANVVRFLITWGGAEPSPSGADVGYLARAVEQIQAFTDRGFYVFIDYHEDLYSAYLFNTDSWYTGDGA